MLSTISLLTIGLVSGILSGLLGIGGGVVLVPALITLHSLGPHKAIAISLAVIIPTAIIGALKHYQLGNLHVQTALILAIGTSIGAYGGAHLTSHVPPEMLKRMFGCLLIVVGLRLLLTK